MEDLDPRLKKALVENVILMRTEFLRHLIDPKRDIDKECGYPATPTREDYKHFYERGGIGERVVDIYPEECWQEPPEVLEDAAGEGTPWEEEWRALSLRLSLSYQLLRADAVSGIGHFGILLFGIDDGQFLSNPVEGVEEAVIRQMKGEKSQQRGVKHNLLYVRSFDESVVDISAYDTNSASPRYGQPVTYQVKLAEDNQKAEGSAATPEATTLSVHWTRVIHLAEQKRNSLVFGTPRMKSVFDRLYDLKKILGGSGEMYWKGAFPGLALESSPGSQGAAPLTTDELADIRTQMDMYQNSLQRWLAFTGLNVKPLTPQVTDPWSHVLTQLKVICAIKGVPFRIFLGSEEAQLAGDQDKKEWNKRLRKRINNYVDPEVLRPSVDRLMAMGVLTSIEKYLTIWPDLNTPSEAEKAELGVKRTEALAKYVAGGVYALIDPLDYLTHVLGYTTETAEGILENSSLDFEKEEEEQATVQKGE